jgi:hypothetical protein
MVLAKDWNKASFELPVASKKSDFVYPINLHRHPRKIGDFTCLLTMNTQPYHSGPELDFMRIVETTFPAKSLKAQPKSFKFVYDGKRYSYTPDCQVDFHNGERIYYEVKNEKAAASRKFKARWKLCVDALEKQNARLELVRESEILREPRHSTVRDLQSYRQVPPDPKITFALDNFLRDGKRVALAELVRMFPDPVYTHQVICTMILRHHYTTDFDIPFGPRSPLWKVRR